MVTGVMAQKFGAHLKQGPARELPPQEPQETFVPTPVAPPAAPNRMQVMQAVALAQPAPPRQLSAADLAIKAFVEKANAELKASREALDTGRLEAGKKTFETIAKSSTDRFG